MVKKIRIKFVIVTMSLMVIVFAAILLMNTVYKKYLYRQDVIEYLHLISENKDAESEYELKIENDYYTEIFMVDCDMDGNILNIKALNGSDIDDGFISDISKNICSHNKNVGKIGSYVYVVKELDGKKNIVFADIHSKQRKINETSGTVVFMVAVFGLFFMVSFYLSKFITDPATKALEREKQFISDASHELKTPISAIILNAQAMVGSSDDSRHLQNILSEAERMNKLIQKLLTLTCLDESEGIIEKKKFSLSDSCEEIVLPFESFAFENKIDFSYDISEDIYYNGICDDIKQVISILLDNAFKYTPENGRIKVKLQKKNYKPVLTVYNTGDGISKEALPHIFDRFYCYDKSRNAHSRSFGLGLSIAKAIMVAHGGDLNVISEYGKFAEFTVTF